MKKKIYVLVSLLVLLSMLLSACGGETATLTEAPAPVRTNRSPN